MLLYCLEHFSISINNCLRIKVEKQCQILDLCRYSTIEFLIIHTSPFLEKGVKISCTLCISFIHILLFYCSYNKNSSTMRWHMCGEPAFLMSRTANEHDLLGLRVDRTVRGEGEIHQDCPCSPATYVWYCQASQDVKRML